MRIKLLAIPLAATLASPAFAAAGDGDCMFRHLGTAGLDLAYSEYLTKGVAGVDALQFNQDAINENFERCEVSSSDRADAYDSMRSYLLTEVMGRQAASALGTNHWALMQAHHDISAADQNAIRSFALARSTNPATPVPMAAFNRLFAKLPAIPTGAVRQQLIRYFIALDITLRRDGLTTKAGT